MNLRLPLPMRVERTLVFLACLVLTTIAVRAEGQSHAIKPDARTVLTLTRPGMEPVRVALSLTKTERALPYKDALFWGGDAGELPKEVVTTIQVNDGAQVVFVPLS